MIDLPIILEAKKGVEHAAKSVFVIWLAVHWAMPTNVGN